MTMAPGGLGWLWIFNERLPRFEIIGIVLLALGLVTIMLREF